MKPKETTALLQENHAVLKDHHVKALYLFGSVVRGEDKLGSDVEHPGGIPARGPCRSVRPSQVAAAIIGNPWQTRGSDDP